MIFRPKRLLSALGIFAAMVLINPSGHAHPHVWIDMRTAVLFDDAGNIEALQVHWKFDELYSLFLIEELGGESGELTPAQLSSLAQQNIENLKSHSYFTFIEVAGEQPDYGDVTQFESTVKNGRITLDFIVPLEKSVDPLMQAFSYAVYDPQYYISFLHVTNTPVVLEPDARPDCRYAIKEPNPDFETVSLANSLDKTESAGDGLGVLFAEQVSVVCE